MNKKLEVNDSRSLWINIFYHSQSWVISRKNKICSYPELNCSSYISKWFIRVLFCSFLLCSVHAENQIVQFCIIMGLFGMKVRDIWWLSTQTRIHNNKLTSACKHFTGSGFNSEFPKVQSWEQRSFSFQEHVQSHFVLTMILISNNLWYEDWRIRFKKRLFLVYRNGKVSNVPVHFL